MRGALDGVPEHVPNACRIGPEGRGDAGRQALRYETHALEHARPGEIEIHVVLENDVDHRESECGLRPDDAHPCESLQIRSERIGDLVLDLLRAVSWPVGEDDDLVVRQVRDGVDRR